MSGESASDPAFASSVSSYLIAIMICVWEFWAALYKSEIAFVRPNVVVKDSKVC